KKEINYIKDEFRDKIKIVVINQYNRIACAVNIPDNKKTLHDIIESYRKAGNDILARYNKAGAKQVAIVSLLGRAELSLAFAEGIALGNYQFLKYRKDASKERNTVRGISIVDEAVSKRDVELLQISTNA